MPLVIITAIISGAGMAIIVLRHLSRVRLIDKDDFLIKLGQTKPIILDVHRFVVLPTINLFLEKTSAVFYKGAEKLTSSFHGAVSKFNDSLLKLNNYLHGKTAPKKNGDSSEYWTDVNEFKNGLDEGDRE